MASIAQPKKEGISVKVEKKDIYCQQRHIRGRWGRNGLNGAKYVHTDLASDYTDFPFRRGGIVEI